MPVCQCNTVILYIMHSSHGSQLCICWNMSSSRDMKPVFQVVLVDDAFRNVQVYIEHYINQMFECKVFCGEKKLFVPHSTKVQTHVDPWDSTWESTLCDTLNRKEFTTNSHSFRSFTASPRWKGYPKHQRAELVQLVQGFSVRWPFEMSMQKKKARCWKRKISMPPSSQARMRMAQEFGPWVFWFLDDLILHPIWQGKKPPEVVLLFFLGSFCQRAQGAMFGKAVPKQDAMGRKIQHLTLMVCQPRAKHA